MTATQKLLNALSKGSALTAKQISSRYGVKNAYDAIAYLRKQGYKIKGTATKLSTGDVVNKYSLV